MPRRKSSLKKRRADKKRRLRNLRIKNDLKKAIKKFRALLSAKSFDEAKSLLVKVFSKLDKAAKKGIIHKNASCRKKSRLTKKMSADVATLSEKKAPAETGQP
jgi:small subunit ribosomal protein S20